MERITVTITADTCDMGASVLESLNEWIKCVRLPFSVDVTVHEVLNTPDALDELEQELSGGR